MHALADGHASEHGPAEYHADGTRPKLQLLSIVGLSWFSPFSSGQASSPMRMRVAWSSLLQLGLSARALCSDLRGFAFLRSRGSTHRSYFRSGGRNLSALKACSMCQGNTAFATVRLANKIVHRVAYVSTTQINLRLL